MDRGAWRGTVRGVANSGTRLSDVRVHFAFLSTQKQGRGWLGDGAARVEEARPPARAEAVTRRGSKSRG